MHQLVSSCASVTMAFFLRHRTLHLTALKSSILRNTCVACLSRHRTNMLKCDMQTNMLKCDMLRDRHVVGINHIFNTLTPSKTKQKSHETNHKVQFSLQSELLQKVYNPEQ